MTSRNSVAEAFAVSGDRIVKVGTTKQIRSMIAPTTRVIDAGRKLVLPGFNDSHVHFMTIGNMFSSINLSDVKDTSEITTRVARYVRFLPKGRWILGGAWSVGPNRKAIDAVSPDNPVFVYRSDAKSAFANASAMRLGGVKPGDADVDRDASGAPTGVVRGNAMHRIAAFVPKNHTQNWAEVAETATKYAASLGVTSVQDMHSDDSRAIYRELRRQGKLRTRIYDCTPLKDWPELSLAGDDALVRGGCLKSFSDSGDESALRDIAAADKAGLQIMIHAIGNSAIASVLDGFDRAVKSNGTRDRRLRVEHAHNPRVADLRRFGRSGYIASMQPHLFNGGSGEYYATLLKHGTRLAFGSDASITDFNPLLGIHAAVNAGSESISVYDAVFAYTAGSAYGEFQDRQKGTIEAGKLADFVILSDDIFSIDTSRIDRARIALTVVNGNVAFESK